LSESEEEQWKQERFQTAIKHYKQVLDKLSSAESETKRKIQISLAEALFDGKEFDEAVILYENAFNVRLNLLLLFKKIFLELSHFII
jgi:tetratricopeptide (TPR) repeat protein